MSKSEYEESLYWKNPHSDHDARYIWQLAEVTMRPQLFEIAHEIQKKADRIRELELQLAKSQEILCKYTMDSSTNILKALISNLDNAL